MHMCAHLHAALDDRKRELPCARIYAHRAPASNLKYLGVQGSLCFDQLLLLQREAGLFLNHVSHLQACPHRITRHASLSCARILCIAYQHARARSCCFGAVSERARVCAPASLRVCLRALHMRVCACVRVHVRTSACTRVLSCSTANAALLPRAQKRADLVLKARLQLVQRRGDLVDLSAA